MRARSRARVVCLSTAPLLLQRRRPVHNHVVGRRIRGRDRDRNQKLLAVARHIPESDLARQLEELAWARPAGIPIFVSISTDIMAPSGAT